MDQKIRIFRKLNSVTLFIIVGLFVITGLAVSTAIYFRLLASYEQTFTDRVLVCNDIATSVLDPDDINIYVELMKNQSEEFKDKQRVFMENRNLYYSIEDDKNTTPEQLLELENKMQDFFDEMNQFKDEMYYDIISQLEGIRTSSRSEYLYIYADTGVRSADGETLYTFIFDAQDDGTFHGVDSDGLGTVDSFEDIVKDIYRDKQAMKHVDLYNQAPYGRLYYAYAPIMDSNDNIVAIIGTDLSLREMDKMLSETFLTIIVIFATSIIIAASLMYIFMRKYATRPLQLLTTTTKEIADGNVYTRIPQEVLNMSNELGALGGAVEEMSLAYQNMIEEMRKMLSEANLGNMNARINEHSFKGDIVKVVSSMNATLDVVTQYLNSLPESLFIMNNKFVVNFKNMRFEKTFNDISINKIMEKVLNGGKICDIETLESRLQEHIKNDENESVVWINEHCYSFVIKQMDLHGSFEQSLLVIAVDITDLVNEKIIAQEASNAKTEFLSRVSHELRTPMNVIVGMASLGIRDKDETKSRDRFEKIETASNHLLSIINDVLDMSRIESGKMELYKEEFKLQNVEKECELLFEAQAVERKINLSFAKEGDIDLILCGDYQRFKQVIINILSNALKFTESNGSVSYFSKIKKRNEDIADVEVIIKDTGIGMSEQFLKIVFQPFQQEDMYLQRKYKGTGLGLSICSKLVALLGGSIVVDSERGVGSEFKINVPFEISKTKETKSDEIKADVSTKGMRVLVVDDIEINREIFKEILSEENLLISEASDGTEAVSIFKESEEGEYDIIFMDIQMNIMDGYEATRNIRALKRSDANIPIVAMTANAMRQDVERAQECGMDGHIAKPISYEECMNALKKHKQK